MAGGLRAPYRTCTRQPRTVTTVAAAVPQAARNQECCHKAAALVPDFKPALQALTEASHCGEQQPPLQDALRVCLQLHAWKQVEHNVVALVGRLHHCTGQFACSSTTGSQGLAPLVGLPQRAAGRRLPSHCSLS